MASGWLQVTHCKTPKCIQRVQQCSANEATFDPAACKKHYPAAYAITYWAHTWGDDPGSAEAVAKRKAKVAAEQAARQTANQAASQAASQAVNQAASQEATAASIQAAASPVSGDAGAAKDPAPVRVAFKARRASMAAAEINSVISRVAAAKAAAGRASAAAAQAGVATDLDSLAKAEGLDAAAAERIAIELAEVMEAEADS